jgi:alpha-N-arabinofuranosidase
MPAHTTTVLAGLCAAVSAAWAVHPSLAQTVSGNEYHISVRGDDANDGSASHPLRTIQAAAGRAMPGDVIHVHEGVYRERVNPPRGGTSDEKRIVYQAAAGEKVVIKGSEVVKGWQKVRHDTWKVVIANDFFGDFNPYAHTIRGDWFHPKGRVHHPGAVYVRGHWLDEAANLEDVLQPAGDHPRWFAEVDENNTTIHAQLKGVDPNRQGIEINVRRTVFYASKPGMNYITVRGFTLEHAATPWAPPTAEQIGLIGTHWSKGWIIENNTVRYSTCVGMTLGKYGDQWDNTSQNSAEGYVKTIERALANGWSKENIGHHVVRNNRISHCEQGGIVGSMGAVFSTITGNEIHDIHQSRSFGGFEIAGIKFHGPIDTVISHNHIFRCGGYGGVWLDWMTQGTRVTGNLLHSNGQDLFVEVNHGPFLVDNNVFLSGGGLLESCGGGAYAHNLFGCPIRLRAELTRETPFHKAHSTQVAGLSKVVGDDERFYNNLFVGHNGLAGYGRAAGNLQTAGNVYLKGALPSENETNSHVQVQFDPGLKLEERSDGWYLQMTPDKSWADHNRPPVTTKLLGTAKIPDLPYEQPNGAPYRIDTDYFGQKRNEENPFPGPFVQPDEGGTQIFKVWPVALNTN